MSVLHVAMFRWTDVVTDQHVDVFCDALTSMRATLPMLLSYRFGRDLGLREGNFDFGVVAELTSAEQVDAYLDHPHHLELIEDYVSWMVAVRTAVQIDNVRVG
ncbi:MAG: Dabb family protein [Candidatus Nanopelagicales bacterium]